MAAPPCILVLVLFSACFNVTSAYTPQGSTPHARIQALLWRASTPAPPARGAGGLPRPLTPPRARRGPRRAGAAPACVGLNGAPTDWWIILKHPGGYNYSYLSADHCPGGARRPPAAPRAGGGDGGRLRAPLPGAAAAAASQSGAGDAAPPPPSGCEWQHHLSLFEDGGPPSYTLSAIARPAPSRPPPQRPAQRLFRRRLAQPPPPPPPPLQLAHAFWNDEDPSGQEHWEYAHSKGAAAFDAAGGGFWLQHSVPRWPAAPDAEGFDRIQHPQTVFGQHISCFSFGGGSGGGGGSSSSSSSSGSSSGSVGGSNFTELTSAPSSSATTRSSGGGSGSGSGGGGAAEPMRALARLLAAAGPHFHSSALPPEVAAAFPEWAALLLPNASLGAAPSASTMGNSGSRVTGLLATPPARFPGNSAPVAGPGGSGDGGGGASDAVSEQLLTAGGAQLQGFAKPRALNASLTDSVVGPALLRAAGPCAQMLWETWRRGADALPSLCAPGLPPPAAVNVAAVRFPGRGAPMWGWARDHSKWGVSNGFGPASAEGHHACHGSSRGVGGGGGAGAAASRGQYDAFKAVCLCDTNRAAWQAHRGGACVCLAGRPEVWAAFRSVVAAVEPCAPPDVTAGPGGAARDGHAGSRQAGGASAGAGTE